MLGIWDTVSALGFPRHFSPAWSNIFKGAFNWFEWLANKVAPHQFYDYQAHLVVENVCHALAIDDERNTFHPMIWDERPTMEGNTKENVDQVWFVGMHSNVGGGYPRARVSDVALEWMVVRGKKFGLRFNPDVEKTLYHTANVQGQVYDSRSGTGMLYRYAPRDIKKLCQIDSENGELPLVKDPIKIHDSVPERMKHSTDHYAPRYLPDQFCITNTKTDVGPSPKRTIEPKDQWGNLTERINSFVLAQQEHYRVMMETLILLVITLMALPSDPQRLVETPVEGFKGVMTYLYEILTWVTPKFLEDLLYYAMVVYPVAIFLFLAYVLFVLFLPWKILRQRVQQVSELKRALFLQVADPECEFKGDTISAKHHRHILWGFIEGLPLLSRGKLNWLRHLLHSVGFVLSVIIWSIILFVAYETVKQGEHPILSAFIYVIAGILAIRALHFLLVRLFSLYALLFHRPKKPEFMGDAAQQLANGEHVQATIKAKSYWNATGVRLVKDRYYIVTREGEIQPGSTDKRCDTTKEEKNADTLWYDCSQEASDQGWIHQGNMSCLFQSYTRNPDHKLFRLMGIIYGDFDKKGKSLPIHLNKAFKAPTDGELFLYANDVPFKYDNNSGGFTAKIKAVGPHP